ncbi:MAG: sulfotransferase [Proteobacteria bacterium]|nr:sulfotransferase [Pseudomonadota bacterium]
MSAAGPEKIVFVGGAPRSGTTVTHALLCTAPRVSPYNQEISFFRGIPQSYRLGQLAWKEHTSTFFGEPEEFRRTMRETADVPLRRIWQALGETPILCVKDPLLTPFFHDLRALYPEEARFVVVVRHPYDVVRSRQEVHERGGAAQAFDPGQAAMVAREYMATYRAILSQSFGGRLFMFKYEDLNSQQIQMGLAQFIGVEKLNPGAMWGDAPEADSDPWGSPKYNKPIDLSPRLAPLAPELAQATKAICGPMMERFGYE